MAENYVNTTTRPILAIHHVKYMSHKYFFTKLTILLIGLHLVTLNLSAQNFGSWSSLKLSHNINEKINLSFKPIFIHNQDFNNFARTFLDSAIKYKPSKNWHALFLTRNIFEDEGSYRHFFFLEAAHHFRLNTTFSGFNGLRYHLAPDINRADADFLRWHFFIKYQTEKKVFPYISNQLFFRFNDTNKIERIRTILGMNWAIAQKTQFVFETWRESYNIPFAETAIIFILSLIFKI